MEWLSNIDGGDISLALLTVSGGVIVAWLTARSTTGAARENAAAVTEVSLTETETSRIEILLQQYEGLAAIYQRDRAADAVEIAGLKAELKAQGVEISVLKMKVPKFRMEISRLRILVERYGGDPGDWPECLK